MAGSTGKGAKPPGVCAACQQAIEIPPGADFCRDGKRDYHTECYWKKIRMSAK